jgi:flagellar basal-body rod protein FlgB
MKDLFGIHEQALKLRAYRSEVIASNLANADTPNYKSKDFDFQTVLQQEVGQQSGLRTTNARHISTSSSVVPADQLKFQVPSKPSLDGNTVDSQKEQTSFAENEIQYQATLRFINGRISSLRAAIKGE